MDFKNCKQIEINGKVFDCEQPSWIDMQAPRIVIIIGEHRYDAPHAFLEAIGAKPVVEIPKKGTPVWHVYDKKSIPYVSAGKMEGEFLLVYAPKDALSGGLAYGKIKNWKPFNPEELE